MSVVQPESTGALPTGGAYLIVTRTPDGRYCVAYTTDSVNRRSYTPVLEQVVQQAQRAGGIPIHTDDEALRARCRELALPLL